MTRKATKPSFKYAAATLAPLRVVPSDAAYYAHQVSDSGSGTKIVHGLRVFRTGTFTDMYGRTRTWESIHLDQMVAHFHLLRENGILPNVPVRIDHTLSMADVVGYIVNLYRDSTDIDFLSADVEFTEPDAFAQWERGTLRNRSLEIGEYEANTGASYSPSVLGLAFVDLPAVEGLYAKNPQPAILSRYSHFVADKEAHNVDITDPRWPEAARYAQALLDWEKAANYAQALVDWESAANYAQALVDQGNPPAPPAPTPPAGLPAPHARPAAYNFRVGGQTVTDPTQVQAHIDTLEAFRQETTNLSRRTFIEDLAKGGKIAATQVEAMSALSLTMSHEQYEAFRATYEAAPSTSLFAAHGAQPEPTPGSGNPTPGSLNEKDQHREVLIQLRRSGMPDEKIKTTKSYKSYVAAGGADDF